MITAELIGKALLLTGVCLYQTPDDRVWITAAETVTERQQAMVRAWVKAGEVGPYEISKLAVIERIEGLGKLPQFMALLAADPVAKLKWDAATVLRSDHALFSTLAPQFKAALGLSDEQFASVTAP